MSNHPNAKPCTDHLGTAYPSQIAMCRAYSIPLDAFRGRKKKGLPLEDCLTMPIRTDGARDHLGNEYPSARNMCATYHIPYSAFLARRDRQHWTLEQCLTVPLHNKHSKPIPCTDHLGREYPSLSAMCKAYGIAASVFRQRRKAGHSVEQCLTEKDISRTAKPVTDPFGMQHDTITEFCKYYRIGKKTFAKHLEQGIPEKEILLWKPKGKKVLDEHVTILQYIDDIYYHMLVDGKEDIWTFPQLIRYVNSHGIKDPIRRTHLLD